MSLPLKLRAAVCSSANAEWPNALLEEAADNIEKLESALRELLNVVDQVTHVTGDGRRISRFFQDTNLDMFGLGMAIGAAKAAIPSDICPGDGKPCADVQLCFHIGPCDSAGKARRVRSYVAESLIKKG